MTVLETATWVGAGFGAVGTAVAGVKSFLDDAGALSGLVFSNCVVRPVSQGPHWPQAFAANLDWFLEVEIANRGNDALDLVLDVGPILVTDWQGRSSERRLAAPLRFQTLEAGSVRKERSQIPPSRGSREQHGEPNRLRAHLCLSSKRKFGPLRRRPATFVIDGRGASRGDMAVLA